MQKYYCNSHNYSIEYCYNLYTYIYIVFQEEFTTIPYMLICIPQ